MDWSPRITGSSPGRNRSVSGGMTPPASVFIAFPRTAGDIQFLKSPDHYSLQYYEARARPQGGGATVATVKLGVPAPDDSGVVRHNIATTLNGLPAGNYEVVVHAVSSGGTSGESTPSNAFTVPLISE